METIRISKQQKKQWIEYKNKLGYKYDYQIVKVIGDIFNKVMEKNPEQIIDMYKKR